MNTSKVFALFGLLTFLSGAAKPLPTPIPTPTPSPTQTPAPKPTPSHLTSAWANEGGDKVVQSDLRATYSPNTVLSSIWDGSKISIKGAKNEVVNFNLILESALSSSSSVQVSFDTLTHSSGFKIQTTDFDKTHLYDWTNRPIELFYIRYLPIKGLSKLSYETYDERHVPARLRRPFTGEGYATGAWADRPDHDKFYPDIAVPIELSSTFTIQQGQNQSIWADVYIPETAPTGLYQGTVKVYEGSKLSYSLPVELEVYSFSLPNTPTSKTMVYLGDVGDWSKRYLGSDWPSDAADEARLSEIRDRHFMIAHRHKISLIDSDGTGTDDHPSAEWLPRLDGSLFSTSHGYTGPGAGVGNGVYSIGTYGNWNWKTGTEADMWTHTNAWEAWFQANAPTTEHFLYLTDEPSSLTQTAQWTQWMSENPGVGSKLPSFVTTFLPQAQSSLPDLDIVTTGFTSGITSVWETALNLFLNPSLPLGAPQPNRRVWMYNGQRPYQGSYCTEDDGVALREVAWTQYKLNISRWFFWQATYYTDFQSGRGANNVFENAQTFGSMTGVDPVLGETGWNHTNGDGLLFYPGTDRVFPQNSYETDGPIASLRLKQWRRGIQDTDYLALAYQQNPSATQAIVQQMVPKALWELNATDPTDPTWTRADISWSTNPEDWETARRKLADIIRGVTLSD